MELYVKVRRAVIVEGKREREVARFYGIHRQSVKKMGAYAVPPGYRRPKSAVSPKLAPFVSIIEAILDADRTVHRRQRHTATRILEHLRGEHGFSGGYPIVHEYVNGVALRSREMFVPLVHQPGPCAS